MLHAILILTLVIIEVEYIYLGLFILDSFLNTLIFLRLPSSLEKCEHMQNTHM